MSAIAAMDNVNAKQTMPEGNVMNVRKDTTVIPVVMVSNSLHSDTAAVLLTLA